MIKIGNFKIRPELEKPMYWVHLVILLISVYILMLIYNPMTNLVIWGLYLALSDVIAHTVTGLD